MPVTIPEHGNVRFIVDDGKGKPHPIVIDSSPTATLSVVLSGAVEQIPLTVKANVPDGVVLVNGRPLKRPMMDGSRVVPLPPGKYDISVIHDDYEPTVAQHIEIKSGDKGLQSLSFTLTKITHNATLVIESAQPDAEVWIDGKPAGNITSGGTFKKPDMTPGNHTVTLKKHNYVDLPLYRDFKVGETATLSGADMKAFGAITLKVTPSNARVTYRRAGENQAVDLPNDQEHWLPPGDYVIRAEADKYDPGQDTVTISPGKVSPVVLALTPTGGTPPPPPKPSTVFENGASWTAPDPLSWWLHDAKGYSFLRRNEGTFTFTLLRETKGLLKEKVKKIEFVANYKDEGNKILYTLDAHHLNRKTISDGHTDDKADVPVGAGSTYKIIIEITPGSIVIKNGNQVLDTVKYTGAPGKVGFVDEVALTPR